MFRKDEQLPGANANYNHIISFRDRVRTLLTLIIGLWAIVRIDETMEYHSAPVFESKKKGQSGPTRLPVPVRNISRRPSHVNFV